MGARYDTIPEAKRQRFLENAASVRAQLMGSGTILREVIAAGKLLEDDFDIPTDIWSVTSFNELRREALEIERWNQLHPAEEPRLCYIEKCLADRPGPYIAATDYMKIVPDQIQRWVPGTFVSLGTDGYGRSDTREALRRFFDIDAEHITAFGHRVEFIGKFFFAILGAERCG